jgi:starch synthase (maltosyl-transferring)
VIERLEPAIAGGQLAVKAVVGDTIAIGATVFRHGHARVLAAVQWRGPGDDTTREIAMTLVNPGLDRWRCELTLDRVGKYDVAVIGWTDVFASWVEELAKRIRARQPDVSSEIADGLSLIERVCPQRADLRREVQALLDRLRATAADPERMCELASADAAFELMARAATRIDGARSDPELVIMADRERARLGAWYELFVRSQTTDPERAGTLRDAERRLADIKEMGFDVIYLAPIHPIGRTNRKGANNALEAAAGDPGSPWAIGSEHGGHTAIEPAPGTLEDFDRFVRTAGDLGLDVALALAIQCPPDHPWVREHPEWFYRRPDGTIRYAENPPKKYQDIYPVIRFLNIPDNQLIAYVKHDPDRDNTVIVVVNLDPRAADDATLEVPLEIMRVGSDGYFTVHDVITGRRYKWSSRNYVRLDPIGGEPVHVLRVGSD